MVPSAPQPSRHTRRRTRDRVFPVTSLLMAGAFAAASWQVALRVREYNSNRAIGGLITAGLMAGRNDAATSGPAINPRTGLPTLGFPPAVTPPSDAFSSPAESDVPHIPPLSMHELTRASAYAETVTWAWERMLYVVAAGLGVAGLLGLLTRWVRGPHLLAALVILLSTVATLLGMKLLVSPAGGAFHPLPVQSYILAVVSQAAYGFVLLAAFVKKM